MVHRLNTFYQTVNLDEVEPINNYYFVMIKGVLLDLSGVLYTGDEPVEGAHEALEKLKATDLPVRYITNTTRKTSDAILEKLSAMNFDVDTDELFTAPIAARRILKQSDLNPYLLIHPKLESEFSDFNTKRNINAVLVGDAAERFTYEHMNEAFRYLQDDAEFLALGVNRYFREDDHLSLDAGPFVKALEYATGREARIIGKPSRDFYMSAVESMSCKAADVLMVGDDVDSDVNGALYAGLQALLVGTGKYTKGDESEIQEGGRYCNDIKEAVEIILEDN